MGKKSRLKQEKRDQSETTVETVQPREDKATGLSAVFLWIVKIGTYLAVLTPLMVSSSFYFPFVGPKSLYFMALAEIVFFAWLGLITINKKYRPEVKPITLMLGLFFIVLILTAVFGVSWINSFWFRP